MKQIKLTKEQLDALTKVMTYYLARTPGIPTDTLDILYDVLRILRGASDVT